MLQVDPNLLRSKPFQLDIIIAAADHVFNISRFYDEDSSDSDRTDFDDEDNSPTSSEESDSEESASDNKDIKKPKLVSSKFKSKVKAQKFKIKPKIWDEFINYPPSTMSKSSSQKNIDEVAHLINQLNWLNLTNPGYAVLYF